MKVYYDEKWKLVFYPGLSEALRNRNRSVDDLVVWHEALCRAQRWNAFWNTLVNIFEVNHVSGAATSQ